MMKNLFASAATRGRLVAVTLSLVAGGLVIAACSTTPGDMDAGGGEAPKRCLSAPLETNRVIDSKTLYVEDRTGTAALIHMNASCLGSPHDAVGFTFRGSSQICRANDAEITGQVTTMRIPCFPKSIEYLSKEQAAAIRNS